MTVFKTKLLQYFPILLIALLLACSPAGTGGGGDSLGSLSSGGAGTQGIGPVGGTQATGGETPGRLGETVTPRDRPTKVQGVLFLSDPEDNDFFCSDPPGTWSSFCNDSFEFTASYAVVKLWGKLPDGSWWQVPLNDPPDHKIPVDACGHFETEIYPYIKNGACPSTYKITVSYHDASGTVYYRGNSGEIPCLTQINGSCGDPLQELNLAPAGSEYENWVIRATIRLYIDPLQGITAPTTGTIKAD